MTLGPQTPFSGVFPSLDALGTDFSLGTINGPVVFSRNGITAPCESGAVSWTMNRVQ